MARGQLAFLLHLCIVPLMVLSVSEVMGERLKVSVE